jgi:ribosome-associated toxin RatA of RatAB toxin-antitoxin module
VSAHRAEHTVFAAARPQACFDAVTDFAAYPEWASSVIRATSLERDPDVVEFVTDVRVRRIRYVLRYHYDEPRRVWWDYVEGDARSVEGEYRFEPAGGGTALTYRLAIDPGRLVPAPVRRLLVETVMKGSVHDLKKRVEGT